MNSDLYNKLTAAFPRDAFSTDSSRGFDLTSVKAQYIVERLNETFGFDRWSMKGEYERLPDGVLFIGDLIIALDDCEHTVYSMAGWGKLRKAGWGDAYKGAKTDALGKACSMIGIANSVFKGQVDPNSYVDKSVAQAHSVAKMEKAIADNQQPQSGMLEADDIPFGDVDPIEDFEGVLKIVGKKGAMKAFSEFSKIHGKSAELVKKAFKLAGDVK